MKKILSKIKGIGKAVMSQCKLVMGESEVIWTRWKYRAIAATATLKNQTRQDSRQNSIEKEHLEIEKCMWGFSYKSEMKSDVVM